MNSGDRDCLYMAWWIFILPFVGLIISLYFTVILFTEAHTYDQNFILTTGNITEIHTIFDDYYYTDCVAGSFDKCSNFVLSILYDNKMCKTTTFATNKYIMQLNQTKQLGVYYDKMHPNSCSLTLPNYEYSYAVWLGFNVIFVFALSFIICAGIFEYCRNIRWPTFPTFKCCAKKRDNEDYQPPAYPNANTL